MLQNFRKLGETKPAKVLLVVLAISFGAWGVGDYLVHQLGSEALLVDGESISAGQVQRDYEQALKRVQQMLGGQPVAPSLLAKLDLPRQVVSDVVHRAVVRHEAKRLALIPATAQMRDEIAVMPAFHQNGVFNLTRYQQAVAQGGMSTSQFEQELGQDLSVRLFSQLVQVPTPTVAAIRPLSSLVYATLSLNVLNLTPAMLPSPPAITAADLKQFYEANPSLGALPEKRSFNVLVLDAKEMANSMSVTPEQVTQAYETNKKDFALPERRRVRHLLVSGEVVAKQMAQEIKNLKDLEKVARAHTLDPGSKENGGDLGLIARDDVVPAFADAAFSLPVGGISAPVKSPFGWHIIGVEKIEPPHQQTLDEVKERLTASLKQQAAEEAVSDLANQIADAVAAGDTLDKIASQKGLKLQRYALLDPSAEEPSGDVMRVAFANAEDQVSEPVNLPRNAVAYVETTKIIPAGRRPLAEIKENVLKAAKQAQTQVGLANLAQAIMTAAQKPGSGELAQAARAAGLATPEVNALTIGHKQETPAWLEKVRGDILALPVNGILPTPVQVNEDLRLIQVTSRQMKDPSAEEQAATTTAYAGQLQSQVEAMLMDYLTRQANVKLNQPRLTAVFGISSSVPQ